MSIKENMRWACPNASSPKNMGMRNGTARKSLTITILPMQSRSQKLTARDIMDVRKVRLVTRTETSGVKTLKTGIRSGHRRVPKSRQDDVES